MSFDSFPIAPAAPEGAAPPPPGVTAVFPVEPPNIGDVLKAAVQQPGLDFIQGAGGALRGLGDLTNTKSLQDLGANLYQTGQGAADYETPAGMSLPQQVGLGAVQSVGDMLPFLVASVATGGTALLPIVAGGVLSGSQKYGELRQDNFSAGRSALHALIDGTAESLGEMVGLPVLYRGTQPYLRTLAEFTAKELGGEEFTTFAQQVNQMLSNKPDMTWQEFLDGLKMTALVTPVAAVPQSGIAHAIHRARGVSAPGEAAPPLGEDTNAQPVPQPAPAPETQGEKAPPASPPEPIQPTSPEDFRLVQPNPDELRRQQGVDEAKRRAEDSKTTAERLADKELLKKSNLDFFPTEQLADATKDSPQQMLDKGHIDPTLFDGLPTADGSKSVTVFYEPGQGYTMRVLDPNKGMFENYYAMNGDEAVRQLTKLTGVDLTQPDQLHQQHTAATLKTIFEGGADKLSNSVLDYYGPDLKEAIRKVNEQVQTGGSAAGPIGPLVEVWRRAWADPMINAERLGFKLLGKDVPVNLERAGDMTGSVQIQVGQTNGIAGGPGTYAMYQTSQKANLQAFTHGLARRVEAWRAMYAPDMKVAVALMRGQKEGLGGAMFRMPDGSFILGINSLPQMNAKLGTVLAHEFGHALIMHQFMRADPAIAAKLVNEWMSVRQTTLNDPYEQIQALGKYGGIARASIQEQITTNNKLESSDQPLLAPDKAWTRYQLGFDEFMADRVAQYLYDQSAVFAPQEQTLLEKIASTLKAFYERFAVRYQSSKTFNKWMDELRGGRRMQELTPVEDKPVDVAAPRPKRQKKAVAPKDPVTIKKDSLEDLMRQPLPIPAEPEKQSQKRLAGEDATSLKAREGAVRRELSKFMTKEEQRAFENPDGSLDFEEAFKFLDTMGVDTAKFGDVKARTDDTFAFRGQVANLAMTFPDLKAHLINSNESVKNFNWLIQKTLTAVQIRKRFGGSVPGAKRFVDTLELMHAYRSRWKSLADDRIHDMRNLSKKDRESVFKLLFDEDAQGAYKTETRKLQDGTVTRILTPEVAKAYGITEAGGRLYNSLITDFRTSLDELETLAKNELHRAFAGDTPESQRGLQEAIQKLEIEFAKMRSKPYVPHTRFGEYTVSVFDGEGKVQEFYQFERQHEALAHAEKLRNEGKIASAGRMREDVRAFLGLPATLISSMRESLNMNQEQMKAFEEMIKELSSGQSFVRKMQARKNIAGYANEAQDYPRVYADYFSRFANHSARLKFNHQLNESEGMVRSQAKQSAMNAENTVNLGKLLNWMQRTHDWAVSPKTELANIRGAVTLWYLGFGVKSAFVNSMSVPMVTAPYLSQRFGWAKGSMEITRAYRDLARYFTKNSALTDDELKMIAHLRTIGVLDESLSAQLAGIREGGTLGDLTSLGTLAGNMYRLKYYGMWMFHKIELVNRYSTALAAYRLARQQTSFSSTDLDAFDKAAATFAKLTVQDTQNENGQWNRAEMMRGGKSVFTMFLSYQQNLTYQMFGGDSSWMRLMAVQLVLAGLMGLPFAQDLDNLTKWFARKVFGDDTSIDKAVRAYLTDIGVNPDMLLKGASYNVFGADLQGSLSMGQVIPGLDALAMEGDFNSRLANAAGDVGGAGVATVLGLMKAIASNEPDAVRRFTRAMPQAVNNAMQAYNMFTTGTAENGAGQTIADTDKMDAMMKGLGFQPNDVAKSSEMRFVQKDAAQFWLTRRDYVMAKYYRGLQSGDSDLVTAAREDLAKYNSEVPAAGLRITTAALREALVKRFKGDALAEKDLPGGKANTELYRQQAALYGQ